MERIIDAVADNLVTVLCVAGATAIVLANVIVRAIEANRKGG